MLCLKRTLFACLRARARFLRACVCRRVSFVVLIIKATKLHLKDKNIFAPAERQNEMRPRRANSVRVCKIKSFCLCSDSTLMSNRKRRRTDTKLRSLTAQIGVRGKSLFPDSLLLYLF